MTTGVSLKLSPTSRLYERMLKEKDKQITILADEIDYLRMQLGMQTRQRAQAINPSNLEPRTIGTTAFVSEEEEEVADMLANGQVTEEQIKDVLDGLGYSDAVIN